MLLLYLVRTFYSYAKSPFYRLKLSYLLFVVAKRCLYIVSTMFFADLSSFVLVSSDKLDLTVRVEDEFTYFATGQPLLAGAKVTLRSRLRSISVTQYTNESGTSECERVAIGYCTDRWHIATKVVAIVPTCRHFGCMTFDSCCHLHHVYTLLYAVVLCLQTVFNI